MSASSTAARLRGAGRRVTGLPSRTPLRIKLVAAVLLLAALGMALLGATSTVILRSNLLERKDSQLSSVSSVEHGGGYNGLGQPGSGRLMTDATWFEVLNSTGVRQVVYDGAGDTVTQAVVVAGQTTGQTAPTLPRFSSADLRALAAGRPFTVDPTGSGARWRVQVSQVPVSGATGTFYSVVAVTQADVDTTVSNLVRIDLILGAGVLLLLGLAAWLVVRFSLRPLVGVEHTAEAIAAGDLSRRVPVASDRTEVGRLGAALNAMLGHIESAFAAQSRSEAAALTTAEQMRRFAADASHELRTPLTSIRGFAELSRSGVIPPGPETDRAMERIESESIRMTGLVEDLLLLARLDQQRPLEHRPVDLLEIAADAVHDAAVIAPDHPTSLEGPDGEDGAPAAVVLGDEPRLRQVVSNLVANALHHTPPGTHVVVRVGTVGATAHLDVVDDGPGLDEADARRVFERFYRTDSSRTRSAGASGGSGLGLSIVAALVHAHGGSVDLHTTPGAGATFGVVLPLAATLPPGTPALPVIPSRPTVPEPHPALTR